MANEPDSLSLSPEQLAGQLRHPEGENGVKMGLHMNKGNKHICLNTYQTLKPNPANAVLEIGMGNGYFIKDLLNMAADLHYTGIDYSRTMVDAAIELNKDLIDRGQVRIEHASLSNIPFDDETFDCLTTTNTLYFWPDPTNNIKELARVLKSGGKLVIAYRPRAFLEQVEFTRYGFSKFEKQEVEELLKTSGFKQVHTTVIQEPDTVKLGDNALYLEGLFTTGIKQ